MHHKRKKRTSEMCHFMLKSIHSIKVSQKREFKVRITIHPHAQTHSKYLYMVQKHHESRREHCI